MELIGLWRHISGSKIIEDSFDLEHRRIGPYIIPDEAPVRLLPNVGSYIMPISCYYAAMRIVNGSLAVVQVSNEEVGVLTSDAFFLIVRPNVSGGYTELYETIFKQKMIVPKYRHIGYIKTWQRTQLVYQYPWYLIQDMNGNVIDYDVKLNEDIVVNPPLVLYRELIHTKYDAVYQLIDGTVKFL